MYNPDTDLLFPTRNIASLSHERGVSWQNLVALVEATGQDSPEQIAFLLMLARLNSCATCNSGAYRAMHGCAICARQSLKRHHGSDEDLIGLFVAARNEVDIFLKKRI